eukprot:scaffold173382_cov15-Tisochrysis_lutea.AAC.1
MGHSRGGKLAALALAFGVHLPDQTPLPACTRQQSTSMHGPGPAEASQDLGSKHKQQLQQEQQEQQQDQHRVHDPHSQHLAELQPAEAGRCQQVVQGVGLVPQLAAVLIDPVDSGSGSSPQDMQYPSAVEALTGRNRSAALIGEHWTAKEVVGKAKQAGVAEAVLFAGGGHFEEPLLGVAVGFLHVLSKHLTLAIPTGAPWTSPYCPDIVCVCGGEKEGGALSFIQAKLHYALRAAPLRAPGSH